ncbi:MAG: type II secretion system F family protein [Candidatus Sericytochromatia bacterium]
MQMMWIILAAGFTAGLVILAAMNRNPVLADRFERYTTDPVESGPAGPSAMDSWKRFFVRALAPKVERLLPIYYLNQVKALLRRAGYNGSQAFQNYLAIQALFTVGGVAAGLFLGFKYALVAAVVLGVGASFVPILGLFQKVRQRRNAINNSLPDTIDLLTACVEAGLGLDAAIAQLTRRQSKACQAINQELNRYLQELQMGVQRQEALRNLGTRADVEDLRHVVTALIQGDSLGVGVSQILRAQAQHLRIRRKQRAEEKAMKAPIKIIFPLAICIFPSIFVVMLGPAALMLLDNLINR